ncbi:MAG: S9 family peptidase [Acidobacteriales bacterium]|nr:S9 family peptidase [Terriglobales bacterium]
MRIVRSVIWIAVLLIAAVAQAQRFTLEQVMSSPFPSDLVAAGKADRVAWVFTSKGVRNIWVADTPGFQARQVTRYSQDDGQAIVSLRITPDGKTLVYGRGSEVNEENHVANPASVSAAPKQQVWALEVEGSKDPRLLGDMECPEEGCEDIQISPDGAQAVWVAKKSRELWIVPVNAEKPARKLLDIRGACSSPKWSPDGKQLAFVSSRKDHSYIAVYDFAASSVRYLAPSSSKDSMPRWSPDGKRILFLRAPGNLLKRPLIPTHPVPWSLWIAEVASGNARQIWQSGNREVDSLPDLTADVSLHYAVDERIVFASEHDGRNHLYSISAQGGAPVLLTPGNYDVEHVTLSQDKKSVIYSSNQFTNDPLDEDRRHLWRVGVTGGVPQQLTRGESMEWSPVETAQSRQVICLGSTATSPAMPYRVTANSRETIASSALPSDFPSRELVVPQQVKFKSDDALTIHGQLFVPKNRPASGRIPGLIFTHGGPIRHMMLGFHYMYYYHNAYAQNQYLASLGYAVLSVNYRLGIMYGRAFREAPNSVWRGSSEYKDVLAGARYLQSLPYVDSKRIGLWGGSYGGLLTALGLARNSDIFAAGVDFHGVHDWSAFLPHWEQNAEKAPDYDAALKLAFESSPNASIDQWKSPVLLIHGDDDRNVPFSQTTDLAERLRQRGVPYEELIFPDEIHDFLLWKDWVRAYRATGEFFDRELKSSSASSPR